MNDNDYSKLTRLQTAVQFMMPERKVFEKSMESFGFLVTLHLPYITCMIPLSANTQTTMQTYHY